MLYRGKRVRERGRLPKGKFPKKGGRRLVSGLLALVLCLTLVPVIYADTVVTVTSWYAAGAFEENTLYWVDNNNEDGVRPGANTYQPSLWFRIDNGEWIELKGGEDSTLSGVGLSAMPKMTVADNGNNTYTVSVPTGVLPEAIETTTSDGYGGETSTESRVEWIMGPSEGVDGYSPVEVNNGNVSEYPSAGDNYGWYYVLEDEFNFRVQLRWGNLGGAEGIAEAIYNSFDFVVDTNYTASSLRRLLAEMKDQMKIEEDPDGDPDNPTSGTVTVDGKELSAMRDEELTIFRRRKIGFVFQNYNLVPVLNVYENIVLPIQLDGNAPDKAYVERIIETLGLEAKLQNLPNNLSGGQQQRVAIARALAAKPAIILADEPTGNLDSATSLDVMGLLKVTAQKFSQTIVMITHNEELAQMADRIIRIEDGRIVVRG